MQEAGGLRRFGRDAAIAIIGGLVLEPTLKRIHIDIGPYLRQVWFCIVVFISFDAIAKNDAVLRSLYRRKQSLRSGD